MKQSMKFEKGHSTRIYVLIEKYSPQPRSLIAVHSAHKKWSVSKRRLLWKKHLEWFAQFGVALFFRSQRQNTYSTPDTGKPSKNGQFWVFATLVTEPEKRSETKRRRRRRRSGGREGERGERTERGPFSGVRAALGEATGSDGRRWVQENAKGGERANIKIYLSWRENILGAIKMI